MARFRSGAITRWFIRVFPPQYSLKHSARPVSGPRQQRRASAFLQHRAGIESFFGGIAAAVAHGVLIFGMLSPQTNLLHGAMKEFFDVVFQRSGGFDEFAVEQSGKVFTLCE